MACSQVACIQCAGWPLLPGSGSTGIPSCRLLLHTAPCHRCRPRHPLQPRPRPQRLRGCGGRRRGLACCSPGWVARWRRPQGTCCGARPASPARRRPRPQAPPPAAAGCDTLCLTFQYRQAEYHMTLTSVLVLQSLVSQATTTLPPPMDAGVVPAPAAAPPMMEAGVAFAPVSAAEVAEAAPASCGRGVLAGCSAAMARSHSISARLGPCRHARRLCYRCFYMCGYRLMSYSLRPDCEYVHFVLVGATPSAAFSCKNVGVECHIPCAFGRSSAVCSPGPPLLRLAALALAPPPCSRRPPRAAAAAAPYGAAPPGRRTPAGHGGMVRIACRCPGAVAGWTPQQKILLGC